MSLQSIRPARGPLDAVFRPPGSKSISNRALLAAALADGSSILEHFGFCEDTDQMIEGLKALGIPIATDRPANRVEIRGCGGHLPACEADLDCGESGTMLRFCTAVCASSVGDYRLSGRSRLRARPIAGLVRALQSLGTRIEFEDQQDHAPLVVHARGLRGGEVVVDGSASSQYASALLLAGAAARDDLLVTVEGPRVSAPYVRMTVEVQRHFGVTVVSEDDRRIIVAAPQFYQAANLTIEPDASSAGYFLAAAALCGGRLRIEGLGTASIQGDLGLVEVLEQMGCDITRCADAIVIERAAGSPRLRGLELDLANMPDQVPTVAVLALFAEQPTRIRQVPHLRHKESDRLAGLSDGLHRLGAEVEVTDDGLNIRPPRRVRAATLDPGRDHRLAMAFSLAGLVIEGVAVRDPQCVAKSFPDFFQALEGLLRDRRPGSGFKSGG